MSQSSRNEQALDPDAELDRAARALVLAQTQRDQLRAMLQSAEAEAQRAHDEVLNLMYNGSEKSIEAYAHRFSIRRQTSLVVDDAEDMERDLGDDAKRFRHFNAEEAARLAHSKGCMGVSKKLSTVLDVVKLETR